jgi:hypothetical protein
MRTPDKFVIRVEEYEEIATAPFVYKTIGPSMEHNYLCAVCRLEKAVINCNTGILNPCWKCQKRYMVIKKNWLDRLFRRQHA